MSVANSLKKIGFRLNAGLTIFKRDLGLKPTCNGAALGTLKPTDVSRLMLPLSPTLNKAKLEEFCITFSKVDIGIKKNIIEPEKSIKINIELPIKSSTKTVLDLPFYIEKQINEPPAGNVISKKARHITIIRRKKMKKHKYKKFLKKYKVQLENAQIKKEIKKENDFQIQLKNIMSEVDNYSPEKYVNEILEKAHWEKPITKVKGFLAPKWVIKQHLDQKEEKRILNERIKECLK